MFFKKSTLEHFIKSENVAFLLSTYDNSNHK